MKKILLFSVVVLGSVGLASAQTSKAKSLRQAKQTKVVKQKATDAQRLEAKKADYKQKHQPATDKISKATVTPSGNRKK